MKPPPPPLRFLLAVIGGWTLARGAVLLWPEAGAQPAQAEAVGAPVVRGVERSAEAAPLPPSPGPKPLPAWRLEFRATRSAAMAPQPAPGPPTQPFVALLLAPVPPLPAPAAAALPEAAPVTWRKRRDPAEASRWSLSAWVFARDGGEASLAPGGMLGGSQAGMRLGYRITPALSLTARLSSPRRTAGAEAAVGLDWRPSRRLPLRLLAERRQKLGEDGRSAFALTAYGGVSDAPFGRFRFDAYGQAGVVGANSRDLFADGAVRLSLPLGDKVKLGAGAWAAAQPGAARLDLGPSAALRLPAGEGNLSVSLDWRFRVAGDARPGSGPALTVSTEF